MKKKNKVTAKKKEQIKKALQKAGHLKEKKKPTSITKFKKQISIKPVSDVNDLIKLALDKGTAIENLKELVNMKYEIEAKENAKIFHTAFSNMQAELPVIIKTKSVTRKNGDIIYKYAPIESIQKQIAPCLQKFGFSYHWSEENINENVKRIHCHLTGHGHSESSFIDIPIMPATEMTNRIQQIGSSTTYGRRYSLCAILGITIGIDDDGKAARPEITQADVKKTAIDDMQENIMGLLKKLGAKTTEEKQKMTGVKSLIGQDLKLLVSINDRLAKELKEKTDK
jgi:hypothetical protein